MKAASVETRAPERAGVLRLRFAASGLAALAAVLAGAFAACVPPLQVQDETAHFMRAYGIAHGVLMARPDEVFPASVVSFVESCPVFLRDWHRVRYSQLLAEAVRRNPPGAEPYLPIRSDAVHPYLAWNMSAAALYPPLMYVPAASGIWIADGLRLSPLGTMYAARFGNVLFFAVSLALALRLAPSFRMLLLAVALLPMALHQIGSVSGDSVTLSVTFLGFALILHSRQGPVRRSYWLLLLLVLALWALCKAGIWAVPLLLLIPAKRFPSTRRRAEFIGAAAVLMIACLGLWQVMNTHNLEWVRMVRLTLGVDMSANSRYLVHHPFGFLVSLARSVPHTWRRYLAEFVGIFSIVREISPPFWIRPLYLAMLLFVAAGESGGQPFRVIDRLALAAAFLAGAVLVNAAMFVSDAPGVSAIVTPWAVQGRYFIPLSPAALLLLRQNRVRIPPRFLVWSLVAVAIICSFVSLRTICGAYYA